MAKKVILTGDDVCARLYAHNALPGAGIYV